MVVEGSVLTSKLNVKLESAKATTTTKSPEIEKDNFEPQVFSEIYKILAVNGHCSLINSFSLSHNFTFDCHLKYLPIDFLFKHHSGNENLLTAYMHTNNELFKVKVNLNIFKLNNNFSEKILGIP